MEAFLGREHRWGFRTWAPLRLIINRWSGTDQEVCIGHCNSKTVHTLTSWLGYHCDCDQFIKATYYDTHSGSVVLL